ncbi:MAG: porin [Pseudomonadota bacterium]
MKKTILASAIAAAVMAAPMTASANVVIYGKIHASIDYVSPDADFVGDVDEDEGFIFNDSNSQWAITDRTSRIGFKGSEDLGNGLKAIWKAETHYDIDNGGWGSGRNAYIGLAGDWGTVLIGRHDTPLKISTGRLDVFSDMMADYNSTVGFIDLRPDNVIAYISPNWNGFTFAAAGVASEDYGDDLVGDGGYSVAAMYFNNGFYGSVAWEDVSDVTGFDTFEYGRVGLGYIMNAFTLGVVYENVTRDGIFGGDADSDKWYVAGAYDFGNNSVKAMYGQREPDNDFGVEVRKTDAWAVGFEHKFSVRTKVYALWADSELGLHNHAETKIEGGEGFSMGMVHTF